MVKVIDVDREGKIRLSRKALLPVPEGVTVEHERRHERGHDRGHDRGRDRDRDRGRRR
jgi:polyribonucleotide nucleotidyltransferase